MIKYGINTESRLWESIDGYDRIDSWDTDWFPKYDRIIRDYCRQLPRMHAESHKVIGLGWQVVRAAPQGNGQTEWFWLYVRAEFPSAVIQPYFVFQISSSDKYLVDNPTWVSEVKHHVEAIRDAFYRKHRGDPIYSATIVREPHFIDPQFFTRWNDERK